jgi:hypothetical protein
MGKDLLGPPLEKQNARGKNGACSPGTYFDNSMGSFEHWLFKIASKAC